VISGDMMSGTLDSRLDKSEYTFPTSPFGTTFDNRDLITMGGVAAIIAVAPPVDQK